MKKIVSSACIALILLNVMGYYVVFVGLQQHHEQELIQQFNAGAYDANETQSFKIPQKYPEGLESEAFERVDGEFSQDGQVYRLIKHRHFRDTFHIVYIKDKVGTLLNLKVKNYVDTFRQPTGDDESDVTEIPLFIKEYFSTTRFAIENSLTGWEKSILKQSKALVFYPSYYPSIVHPPERFS